MFGPVVNSGHSGLRWTVPFRRTSPRLDIMSCVCLIMRGAKPWRGLLVFKIRSSPCWYRLVILNSHRPPCSLVQVMWFSPVRELNTPETLGNSLPISSSNSLNSSGVQSIIGFTFRDMLIILQVNYSSNFSPVEFCGESFVQRIQARFTWELVSSRPFELTRSVLI